MSKNAITDLSLPFLRDGYEANRFTPEEVVEHVYDRIESQPLHPVWISLVPRAEALARVAKLDVANKGPLFGIPFAIKDNIDYGGLPTTAGCPAYARAPIESAFVVQRLLAAGAILIGKTNMDQFATGLVGTRSPYGACSSVFREDLISGGSSSGSAVAVASGLVAFSLGTDTAGSGRIPAAFNNIVGLKPTRGLLSMSGVVPACRSLDCVSIFGLSCADAERILRAAQGFDKHDIYSRSSSAPGTMPLSGNARIGIPRPEQLQFFGNKDYEAQFHDTVEFLNREGHAIVEIDLSPFIEAARLLYGGPYVAERYAAVGEFVQSHHEQVDPTVASIISASNRYTAAEAYRAEYRLRELRSITEATWKLVDALLLPTAPTTYTIQQVQADPITLNSNLGYYTNFVNLLDLSAVAVPAGFTVDNLPFGVTFIAPAFSEPFLLALGDEIQHSRTSFAGNHAATTPEKRLPYPELPSDWIKLGVVGAHLTGQPLNHQLTSRGARLVRTTRTAEDYRFYALTNTIPAKPGLVRVPGFKGPGIEIEVWGLSDTGFGSFVAAVPPPLSIGTCELSDREAVKGFLCEPYAVVGMPEITEFGSWRRYLASK